MGCRKKAGLVPPFFVSGVKGEKTGFFEMFSGPEGSIKAQDVLDCCGFGWKLPIRRW